MKSLLTLLTFATLMFCFQNCTPPEQIVPDAYVGKGTLIQRSGCSVVDQTFVNSIKETSAQEFGVSPGTVRVGLIKQVGPTHGYWFSPTETLGFLVEDFEEVLIVAFVTSPTTDQLVIGYMDLDNCCGNIEESYKVVDSISSVLEEFGIITVDGDGF